MTLSAGMAEARATAAEVVSDLGFSAPAEDAPKAQDESADITAFWHVKGKGRAWIDQQNDVTAKDIYQSKAEGYRSVELLKRYTTMGMATD